MPIYSIRVKHTLHYGSTAKTAETEAKCLGHPTGFRHPTLAVVALWAPQKEQGIAPITACVFHLPILLLRLKSSANVDHYHNY